MTTELILEGEYDTEQDALDAISGVVDGYTSMTAENGQTIVDTGNGAGLLTVRNEFIAELGKFIVRAWLTLLGVPYPLLP